MDWSLIFSGELQVVFISSVLSDTILILSLGFVFQNGQKFFDAINVCCCLILLFVLARFVKTGKSHPSKASSLLH